MTTRSGNLGLSTAAVPLLRDLIHERAGLYYDAARQDTLADRLAPLVVERGFSSFLDYYYLLKYDQDGVARMAARHGRARGARDLLLARARPDARDSGVRGAGPG